jgi:outer membrane receptor for ferric coprogen and ferric-rhodotorulic acid
LIKGADDGYCQLPVTNMTMRVIISRECLDPSWNTWRSQRTTVFGDVRHQINEDWALKVASVYTKNTQDIKYAFASGAVTPGVGTTGMLGSLYDYDQVDYGLDAYVDGKFAALGQQHELVVGFNASRSKKNDFYSVAFLPQRQNVFNPDKHIPEPDDSHFIDNSSRGGPVNSVTKQQGVYSTLRLKLAGPPNACGGRTGELVRLRHRLVFHQFGHFRALKYDRDRSGYAVRRSPPGSQREPHGLRQLLGDLHPAGQLPLRRRFGTQAARGPEL